MGDGGEWWKEGGTFLPAWSEINDMGHGERMVPDNEDDDRHRDFTRHRRLLNKEGPVVQFGENWTGGS